MRLRKSSRFPESFGAARTLWMNVLFNLPQGFLGEVRA